MSDGECRFGVCFVVVGGWFGVCFVDVEGDCGVVGPCGGNGFGGLLEWGFLGNRDEVRCGCAGSES